MAGKRGPKIKPSIEALIEYMARQDKRPREALASALKEQIEQMGEISPTEGTLVKMISEFRNSPNPQEDQPWALSSLNDMIPPIPTEALPAVLEAYIYSHEHMNHEFTVRDAKWVARIHKLYKDVAKSTSMAMGLAQIELLAGLTKGKWGESEEILNLYEDYTGKKISPERRKKILREGKQWLNPEQSKDIAKRIKDITKRGGKL